MSKSQKAVSGNGLKVKSGVKAGGLTVNRCETLGSSGIKIRTGVQAGGYAMNRCETLTVTN